MKYFILFCTLSFVGCFLDEETETKHLSKDFNLGWWSDKKSLSVFQNENENQYGGSTIIDETVFAVGFDENFIIAKQHPNKVKEINDRLFFGTYDTVTRTYLLINPADTIYIASEDSIFKTNGKWYHISNGWNPPDSLYPFRKITNYHIIDIRKYERGKYDSFKDYSFDNLKDFNAKRIELGVPQKLDFNIIEHTLE